MKPELTIYLAEEALKKKFADENVSLQEIVELQRDCRDYLSRENLRKIYARMMKVEVTKMMVEAVYQSLSAEEKEFLQKEKTNGSNLVGVKYISGTVDHTSSCDIGKNFGVYVV